MTHDDDQTIDDDKTILTDPVTRRGFLASLGLGAVAVTISSCGGSGGTSSSSSSSSTSSTSSSTAGKGTLNVADKGFTEEYLIADMYQLLLEKHGFTVNRHSFGTVALAQAAITHGSIDLYPEYTGTGLLEVLKLPVIADPVKLYQTVKTDYQKRFHLTWLDQSPMNDTNGVALKHATATKYGITTMSDLAKHAGQLTFVGLAECVGRPDCLIGLKTKYGIHFKKVITTTSPALNYKALLGGQADVAEVFSTDGQISAYNLSVPVDDKHLWPPYHVAPVVRDTILTKYPSIATTLNALAPKITTAAISSLNAKVDLKKQDHLMVARTWLKQQGML